MQVVKTINLCDDKEVFHLFITYIVKVFLTLFNNLSHLVVIYKYIMTVRYSIATQMQLIRNFINT